MTNKAREIAVLTLPLKREYFDQIAAGLKPEEFRLATPFWAKRLVGRSYDQIVLTLGYPKGGGVEGQTRLTRRWRGYSRRTITHPFFGPNPVDVFALDVTEPVRSLLLEKDEGNG
jgi:hypothetical protein